MAHVAINSDKVNLDIEVNMQADWLTCLIPALIAGLPAFIQAFMDCISGNGGSSTYQPGDRKRCG